MTAPAPIVADIACVWQTGAVLGEGPTIDPRDGAVWFVDIRRNALHRWAAADGGRTWRLPCRFGSVVFPPLAWVAPPGDAAHRLLGAGDEGFAWILIAADGADAIAPLWHPERDLPGNRFNDGKIGPDGRYYAGTMDDAEQAETGSLWAFAPDSAPVRIDGPYRVPNGPAYSPDGRTLYHTDSAKALIHAFDLAPDGTASTKRVLAAYGPGEGSPDGMTTDRDGNLWVAVWDGFRVERISPAGERSGSVAIPTQRPTSCVFADESCRTLMVTSASSGVAGDPLAGGLFRVTLGAAT